MKKLPFTDWNYPDAKGPGGIGSWQEYCDNDMDRVNSCGVRTAEIVSETNGRLKDGVARIGVIRTT